MKTNTFSLAPLQGITDYHFRNLFNQYFKGLDSAYTPFIRLQSDKTIKKSQLIDISPDNNKSLKIIPQILTNDADEFIYLGKYLSDLGYSEINWNLGCPFSMVAKRQLGSGLLPFPERIGEILEKVMPELPCKLSIKMRAGYEKDDDILKVIPVLNQFPLTEIIIHPRVGKQMYKGTANADVVEKCLEICTHKISYNGDIENLESFQELDKRFEKINSWMIGRAAISNTSLIEELKTGTKIPAQKKLEQFGEFHYALFESYNNSLSGPGHLLIKMLSFWEYFSLSFSNSKKVYKKVKKAQSISQYQAAIHEIFNEEGFVG